MTQVAEQENPLLEGLRTRRTPEPCALTIFGASGDLTQRKIFPALYALAFRRLLPERFGVVGVARTEMSDDEFRDRMEEAVKEHARDEFREDVWRPLAEGTRYVSTDFADDDGEDQVRELPERARRGARHRRQPGLLPRCSAGGDRRRSSRSSASAGAPTAGRGSSSRSRSDTISRARRR